MYLGLKLKYCLRMKRIEENREKMIELGLIKPKVKVVKSKKNKVVDSIAVRQSERINKK